MRIVFLILIVVGVLAGGYFILNQNTGIKNTLPLVNSNKVSGYQVVYVENHPNLPGKPVMSKPVAFKESLDRKDKLQLTNGSEPTNVPPGNSGYIPPFISSPNGESLIKIVQEDIFSGPKKIEFFESKKLDRPKNIVDIPSHGEVNPNEVSFAWSSDSSKLAYIIPVSGDKNKSNQEFYAGNLYTTNKDGSDNKRIDVKIPFHTSFRLRGFDSSRGIVYGLVIDANDPFQRKLVSIDSSNGQEKVLSDGFYDGSFNMSSDFSKIYFVKQTIPNDLTTLQNMEVKIQELDLKSGEQKAIYNSTDLSSITSLQLSPENKSLVFLRGGNTGNYKPELDLLDISSDKTEPLLKSVEVDSNTIQSVYWSPDGKNIFISSIAEGSSPPENGSYYIFNMDTKKLNLFYKGTKETPQISFIGWILQ